MKITFIPTLNQSVYFDKYNYILNSISDLKPMIEKYLPI